MSSYCVNTVWDEQASVWVASSDDVPGLAIEAATRPELLESLQKVVPELLELNGVIEPDSDIDVPVSLLCQQDMTVRVRT